ncbi:UPF0193 protein EVG1 homolog [Dysidea avara]|uniref:UPF0193 protein EVG1 homolog n=1 Tax=Dysidea avara TaxID=196820 RepID=UPI0033328A31
MSRGMRGVVPGGIMSLPKVSYSKETQEMLKLMMAESKLTNFQQRKLQQTLKDGASLPLRCNPTSSSEGGRPKESKKRHAHAKQSRSGLRSKETIETLQQSQQSNSDGVYTPTRNGYNSDAEKTRLQNRMAFGQDSVPMVAPTRPTPLVAEDEENVDRFEEVLKEIDERREFLSEMEAIGKGKEYRSKIQTEISQKIKELKDIDKERCLETLQIDT